jgi:hypothetical protein
LNCFLTNIKSRGLKQHSYIVFSKIIFLTKIDFLEGEGSLKLDYYQSCCTRRLCWRYRRFFCCRSSRLKKNDIQWSQQIIYLKFKLDYYQSSYCTRRLCCWYCRFFCCISSRLKKTVFSGHNRLDILNRNSTITRVVVVLEDCADDTVDSCIVEATDWKKSIFNGQNRLDILNSNWTITRVVVVLEDSADDTIGSCVVSATDWRKWYSIVKID